MHIKFNTHKRSHKSNKFLQCIKSLINKRYHELAGGRRGLGPPLEDYFLQV
jgi:hypothetical protein